MPEMTSKSDYPLLDELRNRSRENSNTADILHDFNSKIVNTDFETLLKETLSSKERIKITKKYFGYVPLKEDARKDFTKSNATAAAYRLAGNEAYKAESYWEALVAYNLALAFAEKPKGKDGGEEEESREMALAFANRSAVLQAMSLTKEAIRDIKRAIASNYPEDKMPKLKERLYKYKIKVLESKEKHESDWAAENCKRNFEDVFKLKERNPELPSASPNVQIEYEPEKGRKLVASGDIPAGTTVIVETPLVSGLSNAYNYDLNHCHHCLKQNIHCVPCKSCVFAMFCDEKCRKAACDSYHKYECPCMPELNLALTTQEDALFGPVFRLMSTLGPSTLYDFYKNEETLLHSSMKHSDGDEGDTIYDSESYQKIHNLMSKPGPNQGSRPILMSLILSRILTSESTNFFSNVPPEDQELFQDFLANLILHNFERAKLNAFGVGEILPMKREELRKKGEPHTVEYHYDLVAFALGATVSLLNHSCVPSAVRFFGHTNATMAVMTTRNLKKGEELTISYWPNYAYKGRDGGTAARRSYLSRMYHFECQCHACKFDWPENILEDEGFKETVCHRMCANKFFTYDQKFEAEFQKCFLTAGVPCQNCGNKKLDVKKVQDKLDHYTKFMELADKDTKKNNMVMPDVKHLLEMLRFLDAACLPPSKLYFRGLNTVREIIHRSVNY